MIPVVNVRDFPLRHPLPYVYVGRRMGGKYARFLTGHPLANPFRPRDSSSEARRECLARYRTWLDQLPQRDALLQCLKTEASLLGLPLGCWCAPLPCHADVLAELISKL